VLAIIGLDEEEKEILGAALSRRRGNQEGP